jgi:hypothetical protein
MNAADRHLGKAHDYEVPAADLRALNTSKAMAVHDLRWGSGFVGTHYWPIRARTRVRVQGRLGRTSPRARLPRQWRAA